jgi:hypothetical protein
MKKNIAIFVLLLAIVIPYANVHIGDYVIEENKVINEDLLVVGNANIRGTVNGDLTVYGDLSIEGRVNGDIIFVGSTLKLGMDSVVTGDVSFIGDKFLLDEGASIYGDTKFKVLYKDLRRIPFPASTNVRIIPTYVFKLLLVFFVFFLFSKFLLKIENNLRNQPLRNYLFGLIYFFLSFFVILIFMITIIGIPLAIIAVLFFLFSMLFASAGVYLWLGHLLLNLLKVQKQNHYLTILIGFTIVFFLVELPPVKIIYYLTIFPAFMGGFFCTLFLNHH